MDGLQIILEGMCGVVVVGLLAWLLIVEQDTAVQTGTAGGNRSGATCTRTRV